MAEEKQEEKQPFTIQDNQIDEEQEIEYKKIFKGTKE
jgi:hypothetical protein